MVLAKGNVVRVTVITGKRIHVAAELVVGEALFSNSDLLNILSAWDFRVFILAAGGKHLTVRHSGGITLILLHAVSYQFCHVDLWLPSKWYVISKWGNIIDIFIHQRGVTTAIFLTPVHAVYYLVTLSVLAIILSKFERTRQYLGRHFRLTLSR